MTDVLVITTPAPQAARVVHWMEGRRTERAHRPRAGRRAPDGEGAQAARRTEGRRTERAHGPGTHAGGGTGGRGPPASGRRGRAVSCGCGRRERRRDLEASASVWPG
jgi:hypothetical protein